MRRLYEPLILVHRFTTAADALLVHGYPINLATTDCNYGGTRTWFICPRCSHSKAKLFLRNGRFACRTCQRLRYHSQALDPMGRNQWAYSCVQKKLIDGEGKPKGMHWRTFERLHDRMEVINAKIDGAFNIRVAGFLRRVGASSLLVDA